jgi:hypothetical protein
MTSSETKARVTESQLARFGELARCLAFAPGVLVEHGFELMDARFGGVGVPPGSEVPEWIQFMVEVWRWRFGSVWAGIGDVGCSYGVSNESITRRLASVGLTYDEINGGEQEPGVHELIGSIPWLWGYNEERHRLEPPSELRTAAMQRQAGALGISEGDAWAVDTKAIAQRIHAVAAPFGFQRQKRAFGKDFLLHRSSETGMGCYLGIKIFTDKRIPFPAFVDVLVMPDIDFVGLDSRLKRNYEQGFLFKSLGFLGTASYMQANTPQLLELCLRANEIFLATLLPSLVAICDEAPHGE